MMSGSRNWRCTGAKTPTPMHNRHNSHGDGGNVMPTWDQHRKATTATRATTAAASHLVVSNPSQQRDVVRQPRPPWLRQRLREARPWDTLGAAHPTVMAVLGRVWASCHHSPLLSPRSSSPVSKAAHACLAAFPCLFCLPTCVEHRRYNIPLSYLHRPGEPLPVDCQTHRTVQATSRFHNQMQPANVRIPS